MVQTEASILCDYLIRECEKGDGLVSNIKLTIQYATANVIHHIIFGYRWDYDNPEWRRLVKRLYDFFAINLIAMPENFIPALKYVPPLNHLISRNQDKTLREVTTAIEEYVSSQIEEHRSSYCEGEIRDFVDLYIKYEQEHKEFYTKENIFQVILDLFRAGSDTTATSISWATLYLVKFPDIQEALREEIDKAIGSRPYVKEDKPKLIKTRAFVNEVHRHVSVAPLAPPHTVDKPTQVEGYTIPPNTLVQPNLYFIHHDDQYWTDPDKFNINRWIGEDGELLKHEGHFMPFSIGKGHAAGRHNNTISKRLKLPYSEYLISIITSLDWIITVICNP
ncbi:hypothetical protein EB796_008420 [Bugula neritina]|uniref:CYP2J2 n=1 Tax=Bugula neritina TaxID=10212 RepID=A0A7J7K3S6_BUGNE|nr:hypothetical protein EB796_008420 [Bugula neritina]